MVEYKLTSILKTIADIIICPMSSDGIISNKITQQLFQIHLPSNLNQIKYFSLEKGQIHNITTADKKTLCLFPTKQCAWHNDSYDYIVAGLKTFHDNCLKYPFFVTPIISFPQLGIGDIDWLDIQVVMEQYLDDLNPIIYIHKNKGDIRLAMDKRKR